MLFHRKNLLDTSQLDGTSCASELVYLLAYLCQMVSQISRGILQRLWKVIVLFANWRLLNSLSTLVPILAWSPQWIFLSALRSTSLRLVSFLWPIHLPHKIVNPRTSNSLICLTRRSILKPMRLGVISGRLRVAIPLIASTLVLKGILDLKLLSIQFLGVV